MKFEKRYLIAVISLIFIFENVYFTDCFERKEIGFFGKVKKSYIFAPVKKLLGFI
ncbi:hypothetical protein LIV57_19025 [Chryseobacterium sp. X308]|nr:hypothetical protein [Chryseobacterium sp. X308]